MQAQYTSLIHQFCTLVGVHGAGDIDALANGHPLEIDGIGFTFGHDPQQAPDRLLVFCDYGPVPKTLEAKVYRALLETNLFLYESDGGVFSILPDTGRALCATRFQLSTLRAEELRSILVYLSGRAHAWRHSHFDVALAPLDGALSRRQNAAGAVLRAQLTSPR